MDLAKKIKMRTKNKENHTRTRIMEQKTRKICHKKKTRKQKSQGKEGQGQYHIDHVAVHLVSRVKMQLSMLRLLSSPLAKDHCMVAVGCKGKGRLVQAGKQGRLTSAWKQLWSYGLASPTERTEALLREKWLPAPLFPEETRGNYVMPAIAKDLLTEDKIQAATRELKRGTAIDALGWSHEPGPALCVCPTSGSSSLKCSFCTARPRSVMKVKDLFNVSLVVPLYGGCSRQLCSVVCCVRPIAIPTAFRKIAAKTAIATFREEIRTAAGETQHAAMCPQGAVRMTQKVQLHLQGSDTDCVYIRTDIRNAFNEVHRQSAIDALHTAHPHLADLQHSWLHRPSVAVLQAQEGIRRTFLTRTGTHKVTPLSSLTLALVLAHPSQRVQELPQCSLLAYADDTILACPARVAQEYLIAWRDALATCGLTLNMAKLQVWNPHEVPLPQAFRDMFPAASYTTQGFRVCGLPLEQAGRSRS